MTASLSALFTIALFFAAVAEATIFGVEPALNRFGIDTWDYIAKAAPIFLLNVTLWWLLVEATDDHFTRFVFGTPGLVLLTCLDWLAVQWSPLYAASILVRLGVIAVLVPYAMSNFWAEDSFARLTYQHLRERFRGP